MHLKNMSNENKTGCLGYFRGWQTTQLCGDHFINNDIRIPEFNQPVFHGKYPFVFLRGSINISYVHSLNKAQPAWKIMVNNGMSPEVFEPCSNAPEQIRMPKHAHCSLLQSWFWVVGNKRVPFNTEPNRVWLEHQGWVISFTFTPKPRPEGCAVETAAKKALQVGGMCCCCCCCWTGWTNWWLLKMRDVFKY